MSDTPHVPQVSNSFLDDDHYAYCSCGWRDPSAHTSAATAWMSANIHARDIVTTARAAICKRDGRAACPRGTPGCDCVRDAT